MRTERYHLLSLAMAGLCPCSRRSLRSKVVLFGDTAVAFIGGVSEHVWRDAFGLTNGEDIDGQCCWSRVKLRVLPGMSEG